MITLITSLFKSSTAIFTFLGGIFTFAVYFLGKSKAREEVKTEILEGNIKNVTQEAERVATIQKEQTKIASEPTPDRDDLYNQLFDIPTDHKK